MRKWLASEEVSGEKGRSGSYTLNWANGLQEHFKKQGRKTRNTFRRGVGGEMRKN